MEVTEPTDRPGACQVARQYAVTALELDPRSDLAQHLMGRWHWEMAQLNSVVRFLVNSRPPFCSEKDVKALWLSRLKCILCRAELYLCTSIMCVRQSNSEHPVLLAHLALLAGTNCAAGADHQICCLSLAPVCVASEA